MTLATRIDLPAPTRPVGGLLAASRPLPGGWERGVTFSDSWCLEPSPWPYCIDPEERDSLDPKIMVSLADAPTFEPVGLFQGVECTLLSTDAAGEEAAESLDVTRDWLLGRELATGLTTGNPSLADATPVAPAGAGIVEALATIEGAAAAGLYGRLAFIHASWADLTRLAAAQAIWRDGRAWRTAAGNLVVSSSGYNFTGKLHATGEVFSQTSAMDTRADENRSINLMAAYAEALGLVAFAPCFNVSVEVT